jgi:NADH:ubiquinone oxidoreductase subunit E
MTELSVCIGSACHLKGAYNVICTFQHLIEEHGLHDEIAFSAKFCSKECHKPGVAVALNGVKSVIAAEEARKFFQEHVLPTAESNRD